MGVPNVVLVCEKVMTAAKSLPQSAIGWWLHVALQGRMQGRLALQCRASLVAPVKSQVSCSVVVHFKDGKSLDEINPVDIAVCRFKSIEHRHQHASQRR